MPLRPRVCVTERRGRLTKWEIERRMVLGREWRKTKGLIANSLVLSRQKTPGYWQCRPAFAERVDVETVVRLISKVEAESK